MLCSRGPPFEDFHPINCTRVRKERKPLLAPANFLETHCRAGTLSGGANCVESDEARGVVSTRRRHQDLRPRHRARSAFAGRPRRGDRPVGPERLGQNDDDPGAVGADLASTTAGEQSWAWTSLNGTLDIRRAVGFAPEDECLFPHVVGVGFVAYAGELVGMRPHDALQRAHEVLDYVGLGEARYRKVESYSSGMKQRLKLASAIVHDPQAADSRRADQRHGPGRAAGGARAGPRPGPPQGHEPIVLEPLAAGRRIRLRPCGRARQRAACGRGKDPGAQASSRAELRGPTEGRHGRLCATARRRPAARPPGATTCWWLRFPTGSRRGCCGKRPRPKASRFAICVPSGARWKRCFSTPWSTPDADFRSRLSALVGHTRGPCVAMAGHHAAGPARRLGGAGDAAAVDFRRGAGGAAGLCARHVGLVGTAVGLDSIGDMPMFGFLDREVLAGPRAFRVEIWTICYSYFLRTETFFAMVLILFTGPNLISQDLRYNALPLYFSRPLRRIDYLLGKLGVIVALLGAVIVVPAIAAYLLGMLFSLDITILRDTYRILLASVGLRRGAVAVGGAVDPGAVVAVAQFAVRGACFGLGCGSSPSSVSTACSEMANRPTADSSATRRAAAAERRTHGSSSKPCRARQLAAAGLVHRQSEAHQRQRCSAPTRPGRRSADCSPRIVAPGICSWSGGRSARGIGRRQCSPHSWYFPHAY